jgi:hypothetical protein
MILVMQALPALLTPMMNFSLLSTTLVSDTFTVLNCLTGVNNTAEEFLNGVNGTGKAILHSCQQQR